MKHTTKAALASKDMLELSRTNHFGPPPVNYIKQLREQSHETLESMAAKCSISKQALIRLEQGTYAELLPVVLNYYLTNYAVSELTLTDSYLEFQTKQRSRNYQYFGLDLETDPFKDRHPFRQLRDRLNYNPTEVCKALCLPQATIDFFEKKYKHQQSVPKGVVNVLHEIGYTGQDIVSFKDSYGIWRQRVLATNVVPFRSKHG